MGWVLKDGVIENEGSAKTAKRAVPLQVQPFLGQSCIEL